MGVDIEERRAFPSIYVGETSCSIYERAKEHLKDAGNRLKESHMVKHWLNHHAGEGEPDFRFTIIRVYKDSLSRHIGDSVRIKLRGNVLNSQAVYSRCRLPRLDVNNSWMTERQLALEEES